MSELEPGTPVRVIIEGEVLSVLPEGVLDVRTSGQMQRFLVRPGDPDITVTPLNSERPKLDHDSLRALLAEHMRGNTYLCTRVWEAWQYGTMTDEDFEPAGENDEFMDDLTQGILVLIQAAHPEWTP